MRKSAFEQLSKRIPEILDTDREQDLRVKKAKESFEFFCNTYLPQYFSCPPAEYQKILYSIIESQCVSRENYEKMLQFIPEDFRETFHVSGHLEGVADVEPRGSGKTTRWSFAYPLWLTLTGRKKFIVLTGSDRASAQGFLESIKEELEGNEQLIKDFGNQKVSGKTWSKSTIVLKNEARISAYGKGTAMRGMKNRQYRPDFVIVDDAFKDNEAESFTMREKVHRWFNRTVLGLGDTNTFYVMVNTITHNDDLISRTLKEIKDGKKAKWVGIRLSAEVKEGQPLWPERYSWQWLKDKQSSIGSIAYAQEFLSRALSDEDRLFRRAWFQKIEFNEIPKALKKFEGIDPATGAHDMSAVCDVGVSSSMGKIIVLGSHGKTESTQKFKERLFARFAMYKYKTAYMESVAFQEVYKNEILRDGIKRGVALPIRSAKTGRGSKAQRLTMLSPLIENGTIVFAPGNDMLIDQLCEFPTGKYDDLCDALYYAVKATKLKGIDDSTEDYELNKENSVKLKDLRRKLKI